LNTHKLSNRYIGVLVWAVLSLAIVGCEPPKETPATRSKTATAESTPASQAVQQAAAEIQKGDFAGAEQTLKQVSANPANASVASLEQAIKEYQRIEADRKARKEKALADQLAQIEKLRKKYEPEVAPDPNQMGEILAEVVKTGEYTDAAQKETLLENPFVRRVISRAQEKGKQLADEGKWVDAYTSCYYWLSSLFENKPEYKHFAEQLTEMATVEMALQDDSCGATSKDRHAGIKPDMFLKAIGALDMYYVSPIDYAEMAKKSVLRCRLLGEVLMRSKAKLAYSADKDKAEAWIAGIGKIEKSVAEDKEMNKNRLLTVFDEVLALNEVSLGLPKEIVIAQFTEAALASLDPFTNLIWPWQVSDFQKNMTKQFTGIGIEISKATGMLKVVSLLPDTPAYTSGLDAEDIITAVDGEPTKEMSIFCAVSKITGPVNTQVTLTVKHAATKKVEDITITRKRIVVPPIRGWQRDENGAWRYMIDPQAGIGYLRITDFTESVVEDADRILKEMEDQGLKGLIIDLRFNSGGYLVSASGISDLFLESGLIVKSKPRQGSSDPIMAHKAGTHPNYPIVVLINGQSASASEIVAGALQDEKYKRALLVGSRTYGKGSVQIVVPFTGDGSQLKYTMAYYYLPSDQPVKNRYVMEKLGRKDWGVAPDVEVELKLNELRAMIDVQRANDVLAKADHDKTNPVKRFTLAETLKSDPQMEVGILVLKARMIQAGIALPLPAAPTTSEK
jgi:carboxyl-terminal processing protease